MIVSRSIHASLLNQWVSAEAVSGPWKTNLLNSFCVHFTPLDQPYALFCLVCLLFTSCLWQNLHGYLGSGTLHFTALYCTSQVLQSFYKLKAKPSTSRKPATCSVAKLLCSGTSIILRVCLYLIWIGTGTILDSSFLYLYFKLLQLASVLISYLGIILEITNHLQPACLGQV